MVRRVEETEWNDDRWDEDELDADDWDDQDDEPMVPCPYCRREIFEDSVRCPHCGEYISEEDAPPGRKPWWIIIGALLGLVAILVWMTMR
ncbi:MAG: zinc ribbon domain-containing protein [Planctomycetes bacterium]|nr:zinc ribbon domain-containing protein [Planctomycetota bacterium]MBU4400629.1 zinc ribbon domain-containing protein [Planctomycetota bacterium]MCG2682210.1 hypothetical protein [Planctomycetales bacterium]